MPGSLSISVNHLGVVAQLNAAGRYDRMTDDVFNLTCEKPTSVHDFVTLHAPEFTLNRLEALS